VLTVNVTAQHIAAGRRQQCEACPVALALAPHFPGHSAWVVLLSTYTLRLYAEGDGDCIAEAPLPDEVGDRIYRFDHQGVMEPFTFEMEAPRGYP
jgi:hypothetical protein